MQLPPGWYSAMGQGQGMSTLVRAFNLTGDKKYLETAEKALHLYTVRAWYTWSEFMVLAIVQKMTKCILWHFSVHTIYDNFAIHKF